MLFDLFFSIIEFFSDKIFSIFPTYLDNPLPEGFIDNITLIATKAHVINNLPIVRVVYEVFLWWFPIALIFFTIRFVKYIINFIPGVSLNNQI